MKKLIALSISIILVVITVFSANALDPLPAEELAERNFKNYYEYKTDGKKIKTISVSYIRAAETSGYYLIKFTSEDAEGKEYYNTFGKDNGYYESSDVTNLLYPSGYVVCEGSNMYTGYNMKQKDDTPYPEFYFTLRDGSEWTDKDFMSLSVACAIYPELADALVGMEENIGIVPSEEMPSEETTQLTTETTEPTATEPTAPALQLQIPPKGISLKAGETEKINISNETVKNWSSSDKKVATVKNGKVTALKKGNAIITATLKNGEKITVKVKVTSDPKLNKTAKKLKVKGKFTLKVKGKAGTTKFKSNKPKIASVTKKGVVKAKEKGTAKITVTTNGGVKLKCKIKVK